MPSEYWNQSDGGFKSKIIEKSPRQVVEGKWEEMQMFSDKHWEKTNQWKPQRLDHCEAREKNKRRTEYYLRIERPSFICRSATWKVITQLSSTEHEEGVGGFKLSDMGEPLHYFSMPSRLSWSRRIVDFTQWSWNKNSLSCLFAPTS